MFSFSIHGALDDAVFNFSDHGALEDTVFSFSLHGALGLYIFWLEYLVKFSSWGIRIIFFWH